MSTGELFVEELLQELLVESVDEETVEGNQVDAVRTFEEAMVLTSNRGLVLKLVDGSEYQVTIVQSRRPTD